MSETLEKSHGEVTAAEEKLQQLRRRFKIAGSAIGAAMGALWVVASAVLFPMFPPMGSPAFLVILFLSTLFFTGVGFLMARFVLKRIEREAIGESNAPNDSTSNQDTFQA